MATLDELEALRRASDDVVLIAGRDAARIFASVDVARLEASLPGIREGVREVVDGYGFGLSAIAADWYADARHSSPATGRFVPRTFAGVTDAEAAALVGWAAKPLFSPKPDMPAALARLDGGVQRTVTNAARGTITENVRRDPARPSWYRGASSTCCAFCAVLTTRIYTRETSADFDAHDHDKCFPVPIWPGEPLEQPSYYGDFQQEYDDAAKAARADGESVTAKNVLPRMRKATGRK